MDYYPEIEEVFNLTVDGRVRYFKLIDVGYQPTGEALQVAIKKEGVLASMIICPIFTEAFPHVSGKGPIGFAPSAWVGPFKSGVFVPCIDAFGDQHFGWATFEFLAYWQWLVEV